MRAVCLLSGGMDSTTLAYVAKDMGYGIYALHFNYGQRTERKEGECARKIAGLLPVEELREIDLRYLSMFGGSSLTDHRMAVDDFDEDREGIPNTYVPFRNANLLSIATSFAESRGAEAIFIGVQSQDYSGYPDCRPQFIETFQKLIDVGTRDETRIRLMTPFINLTKTDILRIGAGLEVPYRFTWSCYQDEEQACGTCGACHFRKKAFAEIGIADPIPYREG
ncbi:7-cyano-7-deazaguanine synthase [Methanolinea mesophila]|uniref:7-cyano-7-deazaguanine synthase QueC n=1 Tax=Methanolinea mesophila TaxID=547055 RepID=UPI001AEB66DF|nr:7-cyano-7-deazaguanine synthase QueC [Methanolinea mesophila]MBP1928600.1 7-cyano-7-deazaguanine synthase [Methanolinea mesophila]